MKTIWKTEGPTDCLALCSLQLPEGVSNEMAVRPLGLSWKKSIAKWRQNGLHRACFSDRHNACRNRARTKDFDFNFRVIECSGSRLG